MKKPRLNVSISLITKFCKAHHVVRFALFGSILTDHFNAKSDVDVLIEFDQGHIPGFFSVVRMKEELSKIFNREVDLRTPRDISKLFRQTVINESYVLYEQERFKSA